MLPPMRLARLYGVLTSIFPVVVSSPTIKNKTGTGGSAASFVVVTPEGGQRRESTRIASAMTRDSEYPGTAFERLTSVHDRVAQLVEEDQLNGTRWEDVRRKLLWAGGLRDLPDAAPGYGYTGHAFDDFNHVDLTCMLDQVADSENDGQVQGIAIGNRLGEGIRIASLPELGPGGSWSTCAMGCNQDPPADVAHLQFRARIAFKLVWVPSRFDTFVLVDDAGALLAHVTNITGPLPALQQRQLNYRLVVGSKYAKEADKIAKTMVDTE